MSENVKVVWPECKVCHGKGIKQVKAGWTVCDHRPAIEPILDAAVDAFVEAARPKTLREQRQPDYGDPYQCHAAIGAAWGAILGQAQYSKGDILQPHTVALMLAAMKLVREAYHHKQDNVEDCRVYLEFVEEFSK